MEALKKKIMSEGTILPGGIIKVNSFLNQRIDIPFAMEMGREIAKLYSNSKIDKILTIEASGIALAVTAALEIGVPVVFAKKSKSANTSGPMYSANIHSYTYDKDYTAMVTADFIKKGENLLIVDDFLACGSALAGLIEIAKQAQANIVGAAIAIEKEFQGGGKKIRNMGVRVESLAIIESISDDSIKFKN